MNKDTRDTLLMILSCAAGVAIVLAAAYVKKQYGL